MAKAKESKEAKETYTVITRDIHPDTLECYPDTPENRAAGFVREEQRLIVQMPYVKNK